MGSGVGSSGVAVGSGFGVGGAVGSTVGSGVGVGIAVGVGVGIAVGRGVGSGRGVGRVVGSAVGVGPGVGGSDGPDVEGGVGLATSGGLPTTGVGPPAGRGVVRGPVQPGAPTGGPPVGSPGPAISGVGTAALTLGAGVVTGVPDGGPLAASAELDSGVVESGDGRAGDAAKAAIASPATTTHVAVAATPTRRARPFGGSGGRSRGGSAGRAFGSDRGATARAAPPGDEVVVRPRAGWRGSGDGCAPARRSA